MTWVDDMTKDKHARKPAKHFANQTERRAYVNQVKKGMADANGVKIEGVIKSSTESRKARKGRVFHW